MNKIYKKEVCQKGKFKESYGFALKLKKVSGDVCNIVNRNTIVR